MKGPYADVENLDQRDSEFSASVRTSIAKHSPPFITGSKVANVTLALAVSVSLGAVAIVTDTLGYLILSGAKGKKINSKVVTDFAYIPELGSAAFGALVLLALMYLDAFSPIMRSENTQCIRASMWGIVVTNFIINTALGFAGDHLFNHDQHADLMQECIWSKLVSLAVLVLIGGATIVLGGEKVIVNKLCDLYVFTQTAADKRIGPGTEYHENGCVGALSTWCASFSFENRKSSDEPNDAAREALLADVQNKLLGYEPTGRSV